MNLESEIKGLPTDLFKIELSKDSETIRGKGMIYLNPKGIIELKLYPDNPKEYTIESLVKDLNESNENVGKILPKESYYSMKATSVENDQYYCERVMVRDHINFRVYIGEICSDLNITNDPDFKLYKIARLEIPYSIKIPSNHVIQTEKKYSDKWTSKSASLEIFEINFDNQSIDIFSKNINTIILVQGKDQNIIEADIPLLITTLEFITASIIDRYSIEYENQGTYKRIFRYYYEQRDEILHGKPPLRVSIAIKRESYTELFSKFFDFIKNNNQSAIERTLHRIISAQNSFITNYALTVTTAIETILGSYYSKRKKGLKKNEIAFVVSEIEKTSICASIKNRISGMIWNILGQERADDIIRNLIEHKTIDKKFYDSWKILRNSVNHGKDPSDDLNVYHKLCDTNLVFYYKLILVLIDYKGLYSDYSTYGYPLLEN